jgi:hypothetical protein
VNKKYLSYHFTSFSVQKRVLTLTLLSQDGLPGGDLKEKAFHSQLSFTGLIFPYAFESKLSTQ